MFVYMMCLEKKEDSSIYISESLCYTPETVANQLFSNIK